ncbi:MAG: HrgA protein [Deltaproteobacteria bacterium]|nr:HrgA protein [Deltaproteobacteria bacterium]
MAETYTFNELIKDVLEHTKIPMSSEEIWQKAVELNFDQKIGSTGKTPWATIGARLYTNIKENLDQSDFVQVSKRPTKFTLRTLFTNQAQIEQVVQQQVQKSEENISKTKYHERDLHPLLVKYVFSNPHFTCYAKTIFHENSTKRIKGMNEWLHPDLVGVYFPFNDYSLETRELQGHLNVSSIRLFAFEMKIQLSFSNLRQSFFQAVSNSSWANEGYLVCNKVDEDPDFRNEIQRLSNAFGIGVIKLNSDAVNESEILFPAQFKDVIDWDTVNRLAEDSPDFKKFLSELTEDIKLSKIKSKYDKVLNEEDIVSYIKEKKIV